MSTIFFSFCVIFTGSRSVHPPYGDGAHYNLGLTPKKPKKCNLNYPSRAPFGIALRVEQLTISSPFLCVLFTGNRSAHRRTWRRSCGPSTSANTTLPSTCENIITSSYPSILPSFYPSIYLLIAVPK